MRYKVTAVQENGADYTGYFDSVDSALDYCEAREMDEVKVTRFLGYTPDEMEDGQ